MARAKQETIGHWPQVTKTDWETPPALFAELDQEFGFTLDVCASAHNAKCKKFFDLAQDGLAQDWAKEVCWCNPPYGRGIDLWMKKAYMSSLVGATVVCLTFARTDTQWFHNWVYGKAELRFLRGRVRFVGAKYPAPFPSMLAICRP